MMKTGQPMSTLSTTAMSSTMSSVPTTMWNNAPGMMGMMPTMPNTTTVNNAGWGAGAVQMPMMAGQAMPFGVSFNFPLGYLFF